VIANKPETVIGYLYRLMASRFFNIIPRFPVFSNKEATESGFFTVAALIAFPTLRVDYRFIE
jgi:hypothetical protein